MRQRSLVAISGGLPARWLRSCRMTILRLTGAFALACLLATWTPAQIGQALDSIGTATWGDEAEPSSGVALVGPSPDALPISLTAQFRPPGRWAEQIVLENVPGSRSGHGRFTFTNSELPSTIRVDVAANPGVDSTGLAKWQVIASLGSQYFTAIETANIESPSGGQRSLVFVAAWDPATSRSWIGCMRLEYQPHRSMRPFDIAAANLRMILDVPGLKVRDLYFDRKSGCIFLLVSSGGDSVELQCVDGMPFLQASTDPSSGMQVEDVRPLMLHSSDAIAGLANARTLVHATRHGLRKVDAYSETLRAHVTAAWDGVLPLTLRTGEAEFALDRLRQRAVEYWCPDHREGR
jgi:hypothetical protein